MESATAASPPVSQVRSGLADPVPVMDRTVVVQSLRISHQIGRKLSIVATVFGCVFLFGCVPLPEPTPVPIRTPLPTRQVVTGPIPTVTIVPSPTNTAVPPRTFTSASFDPYVGLYATEREGIYVTSRSDRPSASIRNDHGSRPSIGMTRALS